MKLFRIITLILLCTGLAACTTIDAKTNLDNKKSLKVDYQSIVDNNIIKAAHSKHIAKHGGTDGDFMVNLRLKSILKKLINKNAIIKKTITPILLKSNSVNAYSLSSQSVFAYVYVTRGLIKFTRNDDQLASVLAHEIAHIQLGHHLARQKNNSSGFNQKQELAADKYSITLLKRAGFNAQQSIKLLERLDVLQATQSFSNQDDYPSNKARIQNLNRVIASL